MGSIEQLFIDRDVELVEQWLEGESSAIEELRDIHSDSLRNLLFSYRASEEEVEEIVSQLWVDCFTGPETRLPLLMRYNGKHSLKSWLGAIAVNRWLSLKRRQTVHFRAVQQLQAAADTVERTDSLVDLELLQLLAGSLKAGLKDCSDEDVVMLHLVHVHELTRREVAKLWSMHESQISRRLSAAENQIANATLKELRQQDEHLEISWSDFTRLCEAMNLLLI